MGGPYKQFWSGCHNSHQPHTTLFQNKAYIVTPLTDVRYVVQYRAVSVEQRIITLQWEWEEESAVMH